MRRKIFLLTISFFCAGMLHATILHVPVDYSTIQTGIYAAIYGDTVLVQPGTYVENINFNGKNITVGSLFLTTWDTTYISQTVIDGNQDGSVVRFESGEDSTAILIGFTITNGSAVYGGGIYCSYSSPSLENLMLTNNSVSENGGGIYCWYNSSPNLENLTMINNSAYYGGGIYFGHSNSNLDNVMISSNSAYFGGGIYCSNNSNPILDEVMIIGNSAEMFGGGICCQFSDPSLANVTITSNSASRGGGIFCEGNSNPILEDVNIINNSADDGGGIYCWFNSNPIFSSENRCNIYSNIITNSRGAGTDIFIYESRFPVIDVFVDTFTVMRPTDYYVSPIDNFTFDILHSIEDSLIDSDVYVSVLGDNSNLGTSPDTPFKTIKHALSRIYSDSQNIHTIHLAAGIFSPITNGESFPIRWSNYVNLSGFGEDETILDADSTAGVMEFLSVSDALIENLTTTGGLASDGGGIFCRDHSNPTFKNVMIINNSAEYFGGGIYCHNNSNPSFTNVTIINNSVIGSIGSGGGICCNDNSNPSLMNVTIANNSAIGPGGSSEKGGGICCRGGSNPSIVNCILWNDIPQEIYFLAYSYPNTVTISHSDLQDGEAGIVTNNNGTVNWLDGNIDADPLFADSANGDFHLTWANFPIQDSTMSPCIDTGDPSSPLDPDGTIADMGAYYFNQNVSIDEPGSYSDYIIWNFPNPTKNSTTIQYSLKMNSHVMISIYNIKGQLISTIVNETKPKGEYSFSYNTKELNSGVYFYKLQTEDMSEIKKMIVIK